MQKVEEPPETAETEHIDQPTDANEPKSACNLDCSAPGDTDDCLDGLETQTSSRAEPKKALPSSGQSDRHQCEQCDKSYKVKSELKKHQESVHKGLKYPCGECFEQLSSSQSLKRQRGDHILFTVGFSLIKGLL